MKQKMKPAAKLLLALIVVGALFGVKWLLVDSELVFKKKLQNTVELNNIVLPDAPKDQAGNSVAKLGLPEDEAASVNSVAFVQDEMAWNSQMGLNFSNGGTQTTKGSLMSKYGVNLLLKRQDDTEQMKADLIKFAKDYKDNPSTASGVNVISIMGSGAPEWLAGVNPELEKLGPEYKAKIFYSPGRSLGEDVFMAPQAVKDNPQAAKGLVCAVYPHDGDQDITFIFCAANNIDINPDPKTYNPDAMNYVEASDFVDAGQKYIAGYSEDRPVVRKNPQTGKIEKTGETKHIVVNAVASWTPVDVTIAETKGGIIPIVSTLQYQSQMPNVLISVGKFLSDNRKQVEKYIQAASDGGDQVKTFPDVLTKAGEISAKIYKEKDGAYWSKYYRGVQQSDVQGVLVHLGGSRVHNLADNLELFGLGKNQTNVYASVYKTFGDLQAKIYPDLYPTYPPLEDVLDLSYLRAVRDANKDNIATADRTVYTKGTTLKEVSSKRDWAIQFATGSDNITPAGIVVLRALNDQMLVASGLQVSITGFTDATGNPAFNLDLSQRRALSVKRWLQTNSPQLYPDDRFVQVVGKGNSTKFDNVTESGRAKNRRVEIVMGLTN